MANNRKKDMDVLREHQLIVPIDIPDLAENLGIRYIEQPMPDGNSGKLAFDGENYTITVNSNEGIQRRRFTAAHELGHYFLHRDLMKPGVHMDRLFDRGSYPANPPEPFDMSHEAQANRFAAELIMPKQWINSFWNKGITDVGDLAQRFEVSPTAMTWRLVNLGKMPPPHHG